MISGRYRAARAVLRLVWNAHVEPRLQRTPLVSVVIPTYNWSTVLRHAIRSVRWQTYPAWELIVVGDACTDDSEEVVGGFDDARIRWENLSVNSGSQSIPNNRGIELARGEYIAYLGHDDLWLPGHLTHLMAAIERSGAGLALAGLQSIGPPGSNVRTLAAHRPDLPYRKRPPSAIVHRRDAVEEVGGWRHYSTIVEPPDVDFVDRLIERFGLAQSYALTVCKFNAAWRPDSYRLRLDDEQRRYAERIERERFFVERELAAYAWLRLRKPPQTLPEIGEAPEVVPPGWYVTQWRRVRGLPDKPG